MTRERQLESLLREAREELDQLRIEWAAAIAAAILLAILLGAHLVLAH